MATYRDKAKSELECQFDNIIENLERILRHLKDENIYDRDYITEEVQDLLDWIG